jgi:glycosyltransferase involved in cell wall biosynthesis
MKLSIITATKSRSDILRLHALRSLQQQSDTDFQWVLVNDGADPETRQLIANTKTQFPLSYREIEHPTAGFGLCHARNLGLETATGELVAYLDDDNSLQPNFVASAHKFFESNPQVRYAMCRQHRRRDASNQERGKEFISPGVECTLSKLIQQQELFDSNGFVHYRDSAPKWNPEFKIYADYEYLLQCIDRFGTEAWKLNPAILVNYVQSSSGIIGSSTYDQWAVELQSIEDNRERYSSLQPEDISKLQALKENYQSKGNKPIAAFIKQNQLI